MAKWNLALIGKEYQESIQEYFFSKSIYSQFQIWFPGSPESDQQKSLFEREGFRLVSLCGYSVKKAIFEFLYKFEIQKTARYVGVWQKPVLRSVPYEGLKFYSMLYFMSILAHYGVSLSECLELNDRLSAR